MSICKQCSAPVEWIRAGSFLVPVDETPVFVVEGNGTERFLTDEGKIVTGHIASYDEMSPDVPVAFIPHGRTCSNGAGFKHQTGHSRRQKGRYRPG